MCLQMGEKKWQVTNLSPPDIAKLIEVSDSKEASQYENHTRYKIISKISDNDFDTNNQQTKCKESIQFQNCEKKSKLSPSVSLNPLPHSSQSTAATTPGVTAYTTARVTDVKSVFEVVFNSTTKNEILNMSNIEGQKVCGKILKLKLSKYILDYNYYLVFIIHMGNQQKDYRTKKLAETYSV
ncbi:hypothetical protein TNCT_565421 [Trichonephila clavata]|uniref:Uncharacterized protein n=1 Tax=Trichonephila clavata TaxID=2740835 RepID=A0A8X6GBG8_TRICU|nr:hypothetical protein TNCT_565421 [Trichonephila clavata]